MTFHRVAFAVLVSEGRALLCHRHPARRWYPDVWDLPGGHIEEGESPADAVRRELFEELGIDATALTLLTTTVDMPSAETHAFVVTAWAGQVRNLAPDEHDELRWVRPAEVRAMDLAVPEVADLVAEALAVDPPDHDAAP